MNTNERAAAPLNLPPADYLVSEKALAAAFTEWDRRYREEPERFMSDVQHLVNETAETYGEQCAPYLISILAENGVQPLYESNLMKEMNKKEGADE